MHSKPGGEKDAARGSRDLKKASVGNFLGTQTWVRIQDAGVWVDRNIPVPHPDA